MTSRRSTALRSATSSPRALHESGHPGERPRQAVRAQVGAPGMHAVGPRGAGSSGLSARTEPARRRSFSSLSACSHPAPGRSACWTASQATDPTSSPRSASSRRTRPDYAGMSINKHLRMGAYLNPNWDGDLAKRRIDGLGLDPRQEAGSLSGGQRAQLALTLAIAKRPELLVLDEPVASLDPLARREFLQDLMTIVAEHGVSVILSSHLTADLERVCDYVVVLVSSQVEIAGDVNDLLGSHHRLSGVRRDSASLPADWVVIEESHTDKQSTLLVRTNGPILDPSWIVKPVTLDDLILAFMSQGRSPGPNQVRELGVLR